MLRQFKASASELLNRYRQRIIGTAYSIGDGVVALIPPIKAGFISSLTHLRPDWHLFASSYGDRFLPPVSSFTLLTGSLIMSKNLAFGMFLQGAGCSALVYDLFMHGEPWSALALSPAFIGATFGTFRAPLRRRFGNHHNRFIRYWMGNPDRTAGFFFGTTSIPAMITSGAEGNLALFTAATNWTIGNFALWSTPKESEPAPAPTTPKNCLVSAKTNQP